MGVGKSFAEDLLHHIGVTNLLSDSRVSEDGHGELPRFAGNLDGLDERGTPKELFQLVIGRPRRGRSGRVRSGRASRPLPCRCRSGTSRSMTLKTPAAGRPRSRGTSRSRASRRSGERSAGAAASSPEEARNRHCCFELVPFPAQTASLTTAIAQAW